MGISEKYILNCVAKSIILYIMALLCISCPAFKRNPNLRLLLKEERYSLLNPRWTKSGWIYYIKSGELPIGDGDYGSGEIWRIKDNGEGNEAVFSDTVVIMDISPSETLLITVYSGKLILFNVKTAQTEILTTTFPPNDIGLRFGSSDAFIYYTADDGLHRRNIYTENDTVIVSGINYFDIYQDSLIYYSQKILDMSTGAVVYESPDLMKGFFTQNKDSLLLVAERRYGLQLYDTKTGEKFELDARPYKITVWAASGNCIDFNPSDSKQIIFCAVRSCEEGFLEGGFEL